MKKYWHSNKGFCNPAGNITTRGFHLASIQWIVRRLFIKPYQLGKDLPHGHVLDRTTATNLLEQHKNTNSITWFGHASFMLNINNVTIITDPLLFGNPAPQILHSMKRLPNPILSTDFTTDVLLISHDHGDHIHHPSLASLQNKENIQPIVPLGVGKKIKKYNFKTPTELDWFEECLVGNNITITAVPAVHYSDFSNSSLWAGFIISFTNKNGVEQKIYFAGDSGYGDFFKRDVAPYGPFDIAIVGIGSFDLPFKSRAPIVHTNPEQAAQVAQDISAKKLIGMHWGTTKMADENPTELFPRMQERAQKIGYQGELQKLRIGETIKI